MSEPTKREVEIANKAIEGCYCGDSRTGEYVAQALADYRLELAKVAEKHGVGKDYKDCPAAWITRASELIAKAIEEYEGGA